MNILLLKSPGEIFMNFQELINIFEKMIKIESSQEEELNPMQELIDIFDRILGSGLLSVKVESESILDENDPFSLRKLPHALNLFILTNKGKSTKNLASIDEAAVSVKAVMMTFCKNKECSTGNLVEDLLGEKDILSALGVGAEIRLGETLNEPGTAIHQILPDGNGYRLTFQNGNNFVLEPASQVQIGTNKNLRVIENLVASSVLYSEEELLAILKHELLKTGSVEFNTIISRWGISERGPLSECLQKLIEANIVERQIELGTTMNPGLLIDLFMSNVCGFYMPLIYHEFQKRDLDTLFDTYLVLKSLTEFKENIVKSRYYHFEALVTDLRRLIQENNITLTKNQSLDIFGSKSHPNCFTAKLRAIIMGGSLQNENTRPHWFNAKFIDRWHDKLKVLDKVIIDEHFPNIRLINNKSISIIDPRDNIFKEFDLIQVLGKHYDSVKHLFTQPVYDYWVVSPYMSWLVLNPSMLYDGVTVSEPIKGKPVTSNDEELSFAPKFVRKYISIHPIEMLCADYLGWVQLVKQTVHHEIVHRLQEKYVQCFMSIGYIQGKLDSKHQLRETTSKANYEYLDNVIKDVDPILLQALIKDTMSKLYIKETISKNEQATFNLEDRVIMHGGHTNSFSEVVDNFNKCEVAMIQRNAFLSKIIAPMSWRAFGKSLGWGYSWVCSETKKLE